MSTASTRPYAGDQVRNASGHPARLLQPHRQADARDLLGGPGAAFAVNCSTSFTNLADPQEVVRESAKREVIFLKPDDYVFDPLKLKAEA